ncbi:MAG: hypothetical protein RLZZ46_963 [Bacteroidota bacterium]|jgi:NADH-quinone oxidoreductase subunit L
MENLLILIPLFPLLGFTILGLSGKNLSKSTAGAIASGSVLLSFILSVVLFSGLVSGSLPAYQQKLLDWFAAGKWDVDLSLMVDPLSSLFLLVITGVGFLIHVYSTGYMHDDDGHNKFFSYLNLFVFFMLMLVMGSNFLVMFVGWEGVGLCSYLLIGFWFKNPSYNAAARKAFVMNRIGDLGFLIGIFLIFIQFGTLEYGGTQGVFEQASHAASNDPVIVAIAICLFIGAMGKSAQIPLYTWLPDAMAGPTPVSALIHAATMVTAGIYMVARANIIYTLAPDAQVLVAYTGVITALLAATIGLAQNDIKKVLAYSTVSQLGLMFLALGVGAYTAAVFHVITHAFFKALLFLGAGSVIHAMSGEQDIRKMGGLKPHLPKTWMTFLIGTIAIAGIPPFAGFFSKDEILANVYARDKGLWLTGMIVSALTTFYMFRLLFLTFFGNFRGTHHQKEHLHESPASMTLPLVILSVLSVLGGFIGFPEVFHLPHWLHHYLSPVMEASEIRALPAEITHLTEWSLMGVALIVIAIMFFIARSKYLSREELPEPEEAKLKTLHRVVYHKYYVDEFYEGFILKPLGWFSKQLKNIVEKELIDGVVNLSGQAAMWGGKVLRYAQTGMVSFYLFMMVLGAVGLWIYFNLF